MINEKMQNAMNEQIRHELESAYLYLSMAAYFNGLGLDGMAQWMKVQAMEEETHAMKFYEHINDREGKVRLQALSQPQTEWPSPLEAFKAAYKHEQFISGKINDLVKLSNELGEYAARPLLDWFVKEQIEEEASAIKVVQTLEMIGTAGSALVLLDKELGNRKFQG